MVGALDGMEVYDIAWDAQLFLEQAMLMNKAAALVALDYEK